MASKQEVIALHREHPDWTSKQLADHLRCGPAYVRATAFRNKLVLPTRKYVGNISALGRAAKAAGLTLDDIQAIKTQRESAQA